jgi:hypothetical protein
MVTGLPFPVLVLHRPLSEEPCSGSACDAWTLSEWSPCSTHCGDGVQQCSVQCATVLNRDLS